MNATILIVEDEARSAKWLKTYLERAGFCAEIAYDGQTGLNIARRINPDLILLDLMLPVLSGTEVCRILRKESDVPIIMLTARGSMEDRINGLDGGADDYIVKPFEPEEVIVRIKAVLRRTMGTMKKKLTCGPISIEEEKETVFIGEQPISLSHVQFAIFLVFIKNPGVVLTRGQIIEQAFDNDFDAYERAIDTHIRRLRKLIHRNGFEPIQTVYGGGYKLVCASL
ncbi:MAG: response regulator transcription factor [Spirochaetales bacterium]|nr:response regulator transcription factor [Spirochaetales bacterium]